MARTILQGYESYQFKDHDPILDKISRLFELAGMIKHNGRVDIKKVATRTGLTEGTLSNWVSRKTKRPQNAAVQAVIRGLGGRMEVVYGGTAIRASEPYTRAMVLADRAKRKAEAKRLKKAA